MATILRQESGRWRVQVRRKGRYLSETFALRKDAEAWARRVERDLDVGAAPSKISDYALVETFTNDPNNGRQGLL
jgi:hypothetical protein